MGEEFSERLYWQARQLRNLRQLAPGRRPHLGHPHPSLMPTWEFR
jgi:hypothetical protein